MDDIPGAVLHIGKKEAGQNDMSAMDFWVFLRDCLDAEKPDGKVETVDDDMALDIAMDVPDEIGVCISEESNDFFSAVAVLEASLEFFFAVRIDCYVRIVYYHLVV